MIVCMRGYVTTLCAEVESSKPAENFWRNSPSFISSLSLPSSEMPTVVSFNIINDLYWWG